MPGEFPPAKCPNESDTVPEDPGLFGNPTSFSQVVAVLLIVIVQTLIVVLLFQTAPQPYLFHRHNVPIESIGRFA